MKITKQTVMRTSGWTEQQFKKEYAKFSQKVKNLNRLTGAHYNAMNELNYSLLEPENATIKAIKEMSSSHKGTTQRMRDVAYDYIKDRYRGLIRDNAELREKFNQIGTKQPTKTGKMRTYTIKNFNALAKRYRKRLDKERKKDPLIGSDEWFDDLGTPTQTDTVLHEINAENIFDIFE